MSKIVMPKNSAVPEEIKACMKVYYEASDWLTNDTYVPRLKQMIGPDQDQSAYTKKAQIPAYFGFLEWQDLTSRRSAKRLTKLGRSFYEHWCNNDTEGMFDDIVTSLEHTFFGRNNCGCQESDSDIEPPNLIIRGIMDLGYMTRPEMVSLYWFLEDCKSNYTETIFKIKQARSKYDSSLVEGAPTYYSDNKPVTMLIRWGFLKESEINQKQIIINPIVKEKYKNRLLKLPIYNVDKISSEGIEKPQKADTVSSFLEIIEPLPDYMSIEELGLTLKEMYENAETKSVAFHMFGVKYGKIIKENNYTSVAIIAASGLSESYHVELSKGISIYESITSNEFGIKFFDRNKYRGLYKMLPKFSKRNRTDFSLNSILYGAPGTGKTYATAKYALAIIENRSIDSYDNENRKDIMARYNQFVEDGQIVFTTFHQNYGYEDFVQGIRPDTSKSGISFKTVDGIFKVIADEALQNPDKDYVIVIDEINRANISKVFGELITLIENDKRWGEENAIIAKLPSGDPFVVPNNLYIVGTMNSADKSISLIDTALRRRFEFIEFVPDLNLISDSELRNVLKKLNENLVNDLNSTDLLIGHSYFMNKSKTDICEIFNKSITPLLYEYYYDNSKKIEEQISKALEGFENIQIDKSDKFGRIKIVRK